MDQDLRLPSKFPGVVEIGGAIAAIVPFVFTAASVTTHTENGRVVDMVVRDWVAICCGGAAALAGLVAIALVARTERSKRALRVAAGVVLIAAGTYSFLRGFGVVGGYGWGSIRKPDEQLTMQFRAIDAAPEPAVDADAMSKKFFARWRADQLEQLARDIRTENTRAVVRLFEIFEPALGAFESVADAAPVEVDGQTHIKGHARFKLTTVAFDLEVARPPDGTPYVGGFKMTLPDDVMKQLDAKATPASAEAYGRTVSETLMTGKLADVQPHFELQMIENMPQDSEAKLKDVLGKVGPKPKVTLVKQDACEGKKQEVPIMRCLEYKLVTPRGTSSLTLDLSWRYTRWYVFAFNLTPP